MAREPVVAGSFYPDDSSQLNILLKQLVQPGLVREDVCGVVSPHAGYIYSGAVAGVGLFFP